MKQFILNRESFTAFGIFGTLSDSEGKILLRTLEHAFPDANSSNFFPKTALGNYICKRGTHQLEHGGPFETFEILGVPPFDGKPVTGILFHVGNYNADSNGCVLLGESRSASMISNSKEAFVAFMNCLAGEDQFELLIEAEQEDQPINF